MREIKFRIRLKDRHTGVIEKIHVPLFNEGNGLMQFPVDLNEWEVLGIDEYTSLKDRNGKDIYDGDILHWKCSKSGSDKVKNHVVTIGWRGRGFEITIRDNGEKWAAGYLYCNEADREVIGNVWENGGLLNDREESTSD